MSEPNPAKSEPNPAKEVAEGIRSVFDRIGEFFHLFDLSFFVSGAATFAALLFLYLRTGAPLNFPLPDWIGVVAVIVACYVCGLMSFAIGRLLNSGLFRRTLLETRLQAAIDAHKSESTFETYLASPNNLIRLYIRLWAEINQSRPKAVRMSHLYRYWVMAATYDGVAWAFLMWAIVLWLCSSPSIVPQPFSKPFVAIASGVFVALAAVAFKQGANYFAYQIEDLTAELAVGRSPFLGCALPEGSPPGEA